jgi:hypothetical protein
MIDWLRFLLMIFYAPVRGMRGMRDRGSLAPVALIAFPQPGCIWLRSQKGFRGAELRSGLGATSQVFNADIRRAM